MSNRKIRVKKESGKFVNEEIKSRYSLHYLSRNRIQKRLFQGENYKDLTKTLDVDRKVLKDIIGASLI